MHMLAHRYHMDELLQLNLEPIAINQLAYHPWIPKYQQVRACVCACACACADMHMCQCDCVSVTDRSAGPHGPPILAFRTTSCWCVRACVRARVCMRARARA